MKESSNILFRPLITRDYSREPLARHGTSFLIEASQTEDIARQIRDIGMEQVDHAGHVQSVPAISGSQYQTKPWKCGFFRLLGAHVKGKDM